MKPKRKPEQERNEPDLMIRAGVLELRAAEGDKPASVRMSVSSEEPVLTYAYFNEQWQRVLEILDHGPGSIDTTRCKDGLVILDRHYGDQVGLMECDIKDRKLGGTVTFCTGGRAQEIAADAAKGLRRNVSVGYTVDTASYRLEDTKNGIPVVRAMSWMPYEASFEPVPADTTVGVNRAAKPEAPARPAVESKERKVMEPKEIAKLFARAAKYGIEAAKVEALIADGKGRAELDAMIVEKQDADITERDGKIKTLEVRKPESPAAQPSAVIGDANIGMTPKEVRRYSMLRAIQGQIPNSGVDAGFERECSQAVAAKIGRSARGFFVPYDVQVGQRDLQIASAGTGSNVVATNMLAGNFITALRATMALPKLGVRVLSGLVGDIAIPKGAAVTATWGTETADADEVTPVLSQVTGTPKCVKARTNISRKLIMQSSVDIEAFVQNELAVALAVAIDKSAFNGAGTAEPVGLLTGPISTDVSVTAGTPTYAEMCNLVATVTGKNVNLDALKFAVTNEVFWKLAATATSTNGPLFIADIQTGKIMGRPTVVSENVTANYGFIGDWSQMILGMWGNGLDVLVDPYSGSSSGLVKIVAFMDADVMVAQAGAFAHADICT
jgi:HK97 family phage major capsid protein